MRWIAGLIALAAYCEIVVPAHALDLTPAQTEGPYYPRQKPTETDGDLTKVGSGPQAKGDPLDLSGNVVDAGGKPLAGARVEIWQTDHQGIYAHAGDPKTSRRDTTFQFYGAVTTSEAGAFAFRTVMPGAYGGRPRHIHIKVTPASGSTLTTQLYFEGDPDLARDGIVRRLGPALSRVLLRPSSEPPGAARKAAITIVVGKGIAG